MAISTNWSVCVGGALKKVSLKDMVGNFLENAVGGAAGRMAKAGARLLARFLSRKGDEAIEVASDAHAIRKHQVGVLKLAELSTDDENTDTGNSDRHYVRNASGGLDPTSRGRRAGFDNIRAVTEASAQVSADSITRAERDFATRQLDDGDRAAFWTIVNESDRLRREAETIRDLEGVYVGDKDPKDAIGNDPDRGGQVVASSCAAGYREFVIEEGKLSTCVFESLVEPRCHAGSRRVQEPDLGGANVCLYYSLDFFQPNGTCRENYAAVDFNGRRTCRWAELGPEQAAWYTLYKVKDDGQGTVHLGLDCVGVEVIYPDPDPRSYDACGEFGLRRFTFMITNNCSHGVNVYYAYSGHYVGLPGHSTLVPAAKPEATGWYISSQGSQTRGVGCGQSINLLGTCAFKDYGSDLSQRCLDWYRTF